jgi:hypothetical protein
MDFSTQSFLDRMVGEEQERQKGYKRRWQYYNGDHPRPLKIKAGQPDDNVLVNLSRMIVDKGVAFLFGKEIEFQIEEGNTTEDEQFLDDVWDANGKMSLLQNIALNGGVCGHVYVKIVPDGITTEDGRTMTRLVNLDPAIVRPFWSTDDLSDVLWYKIEYEGASPRGQVFKKQMIERQDNGTWLVTDYAAEGLKMYREVGKTVWPYSFAPICDWQNMPAPNVYFGASDLEDVVMNDAINFLASNLLRIIRYHAHPKTVGTGFKATELATGVDEMVVLPNADAKVFNLEMQSDLESSRQYLSDLIGLYLRVSRIPNLDPVNINVGALSGFALRILYGDLLEKNDVKRLTYGEGIKELNRRLLAIAGKQGVKPARIVWQNPLPENKTELTAQLDNEINKLGVTSKESASQDLGRDYKVEQERMANEKQGEDSIGSVLLRAFEQGRNTTGGTV